MKTFPSVSVVDADSTRAHPFGPSTMEHRTGQVGFDELGTYVMTFATDGFADPWTLEYEETIYVISGEAKIGVDDVEKSQIEAKAGQIIALRKGTTIRYGGTAGTVLLLSMAPVNWRTQGANLQDGHKTTTLPRILFLTPFHFGSEKHNEGFDQLAERLLAGQPDHQVIARHVAVFEGDESTYDADQERAVVEAVRAANNEDFDAIVIACHYDPAVQAARDVATVPVVAPLQLTTGLARQYGARFAVITDVPEAEGVIQGLVDSYGHGDACVGVTAIDWDGDAILDDTVGAAQAVDRLVANLAATGDIDSVVIGCTIVSAAYESHRGDFPDHGVVVINSNLVSTKGAAALISA